MDMRKKMELKEMACKVLEQTREEELFRDPSKAKNLASLILKLDEMCEKDEYSQRGYSRGGIWDANGYYGASEYAQRRGRDGRYMASNGYSYKDDREDIIMRLEQMGQESGSPAEKSAIDRFVSQLRNMK